MHGPSLRRLAVAAAVAMIASISARAVAAEPISWSAFGGPVQANLSDLAPHDRAAPSLGIGASVPILGWLSFDPQLQWVRKGGEARYGVTIMSMTGPSLDLLAFQYTLHYTLDYVELPLLLRIQPPIHSFLQPHVTGGVAPAYRVAGRETIRVPEGPIAMLASANVHYAPILFYEPTDATRNFDHWDVDLVVGGGFSIGRGPFAFDVDARYLHGLRDPLPDGALSQAFNRAWLVSAGVRVH
jgi:hypothetical protein